MAWDVTLIKHRAVLLLFGIYLWRWTNTLPIKSTPFYVTENDTELSTEFPATVPLLKDGTLETPSCTQTSICHAQCIAKCDDSQKYFPPVLTDEKDHTNFHREVTVPTPITEGGELINQTKLGSMDAYSYCMVQCKAFEDDEWIEECNDPDCIENCAHLSDGGILTGKTFIPEPPYNLSYYQVGVIPNKIHIMWEVSTKKSRHSIFHVVETYSGEYWYTVNTTDTNFLITSLDVCETKTYRVATVNQFGYNGYSEEITRSDLPVPGPVSDISQLKDPYYDDKKAVFLFYFLIAPPIGWDTHDIKSLSVESYGKFCRNNLLPPMPIVEDNSRDSDGNFVVVLSIIYTGFDCEFYSNISAQSKCGVIGKPTQFSFNISDCTVIQNYNCTKKQFLWPDPVENVSVTVKENSKEVTVTWEPPLSLGTSDTVSYYIIQWGSVIWNPIIPILDEEGRKAVPGDILSADISVKKVDQRYGVKVIAVVPDKENKTHEINHKLSIMKIQETFTISAAQLVYTVVTVNSSNVSMVVGLSPSPSITPLHIISDTQPDSGFTFIPSRFNPWLLYVGKMAVYLPKISGLQVSNHDQHIYTCFFNQQNAYLDMTYIDLYSVESDFNQNEESGNLLPVYILMPIVAVILTVVLALLFVKKKRQHQQKQGRQLYNQNPGYNPSVFKHVDNCMTPNPFYEMPLRTSSNTDRWEIERRYVTLGTILGRGAFGQVVKGSVKTVGITNLRKTSCASYSSGVEDTKTEEITVAVKMLLPLAGDTYKAEFKKEINLMKNIGYHPNVVSIIGCITDKEPLSLIVEHVPHGDLLHYLRNHRQWIQQEHNSDSGIKEESPKLTLQDLMCIARQISVGMEFLSQKGFVHRDLACRNILVGDNKQVKIGDFGLTRYIYDDKIYVTKKGGKLPLKWMAIEAIFDLTFTSASDVWSFGVVLFELITLGGTPYPTIANRDLLRELRSGYRMEQPDNCPDTLYQMMTNCWKERPSTRPTFTELRNYLDELIETHSEVEYMSFDLDHNKPYYKIDQKSSTADGDEIFGHMKSSTSLFEDSATSLAESRSSSKSNSPAKKKAQEGKFTRSLLKIGSKDGLSCRSIAMHSPLKVMRKSADDLLCISTCSTDQLLSHTSMSTSDPGYELTQAWDRETKF